MEAVKDGGRFCLHLFTNFISLVSLEENHENLFKMSFPNCERWGSVLFTLVYKRGFEKAIYQLELGLFWLS